MMITLKTVHYFTISGQELFDLARSVQDVIEDYLHDNFDDDYEPTQEELSAIVRELANYMRVEA